MAIRTNNSFSFYQLTVREELAGRILTGDQSHVLQNERSIIAEQLLGLTFEGNDPLEFAKQHAYLKGQLSIYTLILEQSQAAQAELIARNGDNNLDAPSMPSI